MVPSSEARRQHTWRGRQTILLRVIAPTVAALLLPQVDASQQSQWGRSSQFC
jgi:hypothetical protein